MQVLKKVVAFAHVLSFFFRLFITWMRDDVIGWRDAPKRKANLYLQGNFAPIHDELDVDLILPKEEQVPSDFPAGIYVRNGPNPRFTPKHNQHWFEGDGHLHSLQIHKDKTVTYRNKFVRTEKYMMEDDFSGAIIQGFIDSSNPFTKITHYYRNKIRGALGVPSHSTANTALKVYNNHFLALVEGALPTHIKLPSLETVGVTNMNNEFKHHMTAHPMVDPKTKDMVFFGYKLFDEPLLQYSVMSETGTCKHHYAFKKEEIPWGTMHHSFAITEHYSIFMFFPLVFDKMQVGKGLEPIEFYNDRPTKYAIVPRYYNPSTDKILWFEGTSGYCFHVANAYEESKHEIVLQLCIGQNFSLDLDLAKQAAFQPRLSQIRFNLQTQLIKEEDLLFIDKNSKEQLAIPLIAEFPIIHDDLVTQKHRYVYMGGLAPQTLKMNCIVKADVETMTYEKLPFAAHQYAGEWVYLPKEEATKEDDGYLVAYVHDEQANVTHFEIVDASSMKRVTRIKIPRRVPYGFHGLFIPENVVAQLK